MKKLFMILYIISGVSCSDYSKNLPPLSPSEIDELKSYQETFDKVKKKLDSYNLEKQRVLSLTDNYIKNSVKLERFSIFKTNRFDDGRERACYRGVLSNTGNEIIEKLDLVVEFRAPGSELINKWEASLVDANDEFLDKGEFDETKALIMSVSGRKLPLKPGQRLDLSENRNCMAEAFLNWKEENVKYKLTGIKLRTKIPEVNIGDLVNVKARMLDLKDRAEANGQM